MSFRAMNSLSFLQYSFFINDAGKHLPCCLKLKSIYQSNDNIDFFFLPDY